MVQMMRDFKARVQKLLHSILRSVVFFNYSFLRSFIIKSRIKIPLRWNLFDMNLEE